MKKSLAVQQTDRTKKQQKRIPQITTRLERIEKVLDKLYEDNALGVIDQDRYEQMSQKYSEEYYTWKTELAEIKEQLSAFENAGGRAWSDNGKGGGIVNACHRRPVLKFY